LQLQGKDKQEVIDKLKKNGNKVPEYLIKALDYLTFLINSVKEITHSKDVKDIKDVKEVKDAKDTKDNTKDGKEAKDTEIATPDTGIPIEISMSAISSHSLFHSGLYFKVKILIEVFKLFIR
jgi:hypothetical protein